MEYVAINIAGWSRSMDPVEALTLAVRNGMEGISALWTVDEGAELDLNPGQRSVTAEGARRVAEYDLALTKKGLLVKSAAGRV